MTKPADRESEGRLAAAGAQVLDVAGQARDAAGQAVGAAVERVGGAVSAAKETAGDAYVTARDKASDAYAVARERASSAAKATSDGAQANPLIALLGGLAVGAAVAALLPRTEREAELLGPLGTRIGDAARLAATAARDAGLDALGEAGINRDAARAQVDKLFDTALGAAKVAGGAAAEAVNKPA